MANLTDSSIHRQNILNNPFALSEIEKATQLKGVQFEGRSWVTKEQLAGFFEVDSRTIERILEQHPDELKGNGYEVIRGKRLKAFKTAITEQDVTDINVGAKMSANGLDDGPRKRESTTPISVGTTKTSATVSQSEFCFAQIDAERVATPALLHDHRPPITDYRLPITNYRPPCSRLTVTQRTLPASQLRHSPNRR